MKNTALVFWLAVALLGSAAYGSWVLWRDWHESQPDFEGPIGSASHKAPVGPPMKEFELTERSGRTFQSKELAGQVWLGSIFFSSCPGKCWQMNQALKGIHDEFKDTDLRIISISCDPKTDTPEVLRKYADRFQADAYRWLFLTGDLDYIKRIGRDLFYQDVQEGMHGMNVLAMDRNGKIRGSFDLLDPAKVAELKTLLRELLAEKPAAAERSDPPAENSAVPEQG
jgi:cytochrome oxidase Cu insertion factor (SCO1/SenC/PrrC family)